MFVFFLNDEDFLLEDQQMLCIQFFYLVIYLYLFAVQEQLEVPDQLLLGALRQSFDEVIQGQMDFEWSDNLHDEVTEGAGNKNKYRGEDKRGCENKISKIKLQDKLKKSRYLITQSYNNIREESERRKTNSNHQQNFIWPPFYPFYPSFHFFFFPFPTLFYSFSLPIFPNYKLMNVHFYNPWRFVQKILEVFHVFPLR